jgi:Xaa-Pro aminopeptidase
MAVFSQRVLEARRARVARLLRGLDGVVLAAAGEPIGKPGGLDQTYPFIPHPTYYWLTGSRRPGGVVAYDARDGWTDFVAPATEAERLWEGEPEVPPGQDVAGLQSWCDGRGARSVASVGAALPGVEVDPQSSEAAIERMDAARRPKDPAEIELIGRAVAATAAGFERIRQDIRPGVTERQLQIELEASFHRQGGDGLSFGTIVGAGTHAAVLHFEPGDRVVGPDDLVLVDAGATVAGYCADVSRTFPAGDRFTAEQQAIYDLVLASQAAGIEQCRPGTEWYDVHLATATVLALGLRDLGVLRGSIDDLLETGAIALFFPHGVGHMLGLGVRDVGGREPGREERSCGGARLRVDLPLRSGFVMTVEPGLYFVPAILDCPERRERFADAVVWRDLERWRRVGGVRIEDDILVTDGDPRNLTEGIPK